MSRRVPDASDAPHVAERFTSLTAAEPEVAVRGLLSPCRCSWADDSPLGPEPVRVPVLDLTGHTGRVAVETSDANRTCRACTHPIPSRRPHLVHRLAPGAGVFNRYHNECVEIR